MSFNDLLPKSKTYDGASIEQMIGELQKISIISVLKEEDYVIRAIIRKVPRSQILIKLQKKYPNEDIKDRDLKDFLWLYKDTFHDEALKMQTAYGRRLIRQQEGLTNELIDLALTTKRLAAKYEKEADNVNTIAAIRVAADIFMKMGKVQGIFQEKPEVNINLQMDKVINEATNEDSDFKKSIRKIINVEAETVNE